MRPVRQPGGRGLRRRPRAAGGVPPRAPRGGPRSTPRPPCPRTGRRRATRPPRRPTRPPCRGALAAQEAGVATAVSLAMAALEAAEADAALGGMVAPRPRARAARGGGPRRRAGRRAVPLGPLHGIPVTVKDVIDVAGLPTRCGSRGLRRPARGRRRRRGPPARGRRRDRAARPPPTSSPSGSRRPRPQPPRPDPHPRRARAAGRRSPSPPAWAWRRSAPTRGPRSGCPPRCAAWSGLKPTYGRVPTDGVVTLSWTMDHVAPMAATVADAALVLEALAPRVAGLSRWAHAPGRRAARRRRPRPRSPGPTPRSPPRCAPRSRRSAPPGVHAEPATRPDALDLDRANAAGLVISRVRGRRRPPRPRPRPHASTGTRSPTSWTRPSA